MKLVWQKTGDFIDCDPIDYSFVEFWLDNQNNFEWNTTSCFPQQELIDELTILIDRVHINLNKLKISLIDTPADFVCQNTLNTLHRNWVQLHLTHPNISNLFGSEFKIDIERINKALHELEESWNLVIKSEQLPFVNTHRIPMNFGDSNIKILYANLGRSTYNKWLNFDDNVTDVDTNNYNEINPLLLLKLNRSHSTTPPLEYANWCSKHQVRPTPDKILLANFKDLASKQDTYRSLFMKNFVLNNNDVIFIK
jgi:hypothetical protein